MSFQSQGTRGNGERRLYGVKKRSWGPLHEEPFILSGCFLYKNQFKKITKRNSGSWKRLNPENETAGGCQYLRMKFGQIEEQRTLHWVPFLLLILASFSFKYRFGSVQNSSSKSCLPVIQGKNGEHELWYLKNSLLFERILRWNVQVCFLCSDPFFTFLVFFSYVS